jgi:hypothetical protein
LAISPGTRLGVYEVTASIGAGGMGQVFRARDTKLNRDVALKVLPDSFASDQDRLARFEREAQVLDVPGFINNRRFVVTPDGQQFIVPVQKAEALPITVVLNWASGLAK